MLSLITQFYTFHINRVSLARTFPDHILHERSRLMTYNYASCVELVAAVNGEPYSPLLLSEDLLGPIPAQEDDWFHFRCADGVLPLQFRKETLARHFLLIRGYIEEHPNETGTDIPYNSDDVKYAVLIVLDEESLFSLTPAILSILQLLTPVTDLYYTMADMTLMEPSFVLGIVQGISQDERKEILRAHDARCVIDADNRILSYTIPERGEGLAIAFALTGVTDYLYERDIPTLSVLYPSRVYINGPEDGRPYLDDLLTTSPFEDFGCGYLTSTHLIELVTMMFRAILRLKERGRVAKVLAILGMRHEIFGNTEMECYGPYQVRASHYEITDEGLRFDLLVHIAEVFSIPRGTARSVLAAYIN